MKTPRPPGVQLGEDAARAAILAGATRVFAKRGFREASVAHVLEVANVARRTFYRHFSSKEDVAVELYRIGTGMLLQACDEAARNETDPLRLLARCIDAHLAATRGLGRLVYVLGGEAQRSESLLHVRRAEVHARLVTLLDASLRAHLRKSVDPMLLRSLVLSLEAIPRLLMEEGEQGRRVTDEGVARARQVMMRVTTAVLEGQGSRVTALPIAP